jgi:hypothetical protein
MEQVLKYKVFHNQIQGTMGDLEYTKDHFPRGWVYVADVEADNLNSAFAETNSIDRPWFMNPNVTLKIDRDLRYGLRSSMPGDVFIDENGTTNMAGWTRWEVL